MGFEKLELAFLLAVLGCFGCSSGAQTDDGGSSGTSTSGGVTTGGSGGTTSGGSTTGGGSCATVVCGGTCCAANEHCSQSQCTCGVQPGLCPPDYICLDDLSALSCVKPCTTTVDCAQPTNCCEPGADGGHAGCIGCHGSGCTCL
jgi:hypothetical protein